LNAGGYTLTILRLDVLATSLQPEHFFVVKLMCFEQLELGRHVIEPPAATSLMGFSPSWSLNWRRKDEEWALRAGTAVIASVVTLGGVAVYTRYLKRFPTSDVVPNSVIKRRKWIKGVVTRYLLTVS
jgi:hypothetical protein